MSMLKLNNKIITLGGSVVTAIDYPVKGDLINMDLDGNGNKTYRVLSMDGKVAKMLSMSDTNASQVWDSNNPTITMGTLSVAKYADSNLDTYLNTTWYNTLNTNAKSAIIAQTITQDAWYWKDRVGDSSVYSGTYGASVPGTNNYSISKYANAESTIGNRYIYVLGAQDIIDYLNDINVQIDTSAILRNVNIWKMFWNKTTQPNYSYSWLRSADAEYSHKALQIGAGYGVLVSGIISTGAKIRPAFQIDLSKIPFTKTTEVIS